MNTMQNGFRGGWRRSAVLLIAAGVVLAVGVSGLFADGPDSTKPGLREGVFVPGDTTKHPKSRMAMDALERLSVTSGEHWRVDWDEPTGLPGSLQGASARKYVGNADEAALTFVNEHKTVLTGLPDSQLTADYSFTVGATKQLRLETAVTVDARYRGVKIYQGTIGVYVKKDGTIWLVNNSFCPVELADVTPTLSNADAEEIIKRLAAPDTVGADGNYWELCIYPSIPPRLSYHASRFIRGWWWNLVLDAHDGTEIVTTPLGSRDGPGWVTPPEPREVAPDSTPRQPLPMLPAEPMRPVPEPEKRGIERDSASKGKGGACIFGASARSHPVKVHSEPANPSSDCWFFDVNFLPGADVPRLSTQLVLESTGDSK